MKRPFRGLRRDPPLESYDALVVGAGIGGLVCANLLARQGLQVLLVEQHYMAGGYCSTFKRAGYTFDAATHFYPLLGNPKTITGKLLGDLGVETDWIQMDPVDTFHFPDGSRFVVSADFDTYRAQLDLEFPHQREALDEFFQLVESAYRYGLLHYFLDRHTRQLQERWGNLLHLSVKDVLNRLFTDRKLKLLLTADCAHWGSPPGRTSFVFDSMLRLSYFLGNYYPKNGSQSFADELAHRFEQSGGHIMMSTQVERLTVEGGRVTGAEMSTTRGPLRGHRTVKAGVVVSNSDLLGTINDLLPPSLVPSAYRQQIQTLRPSYPCFLMHIGLRDLEAEVLEEAQGYYWNDWDAEEVGRDGLVCKVFVPTLYEPRMAPEGGQIILLQKVYEVDYEATDDWPAHKQAMEARLLAHLERVIPGVNQKIVVKTGASAQTSNRFTLNTWGSMLGWEMSPEQLGEDRPPIESPVPGLYLTGHWTRPGGGITPVIISAQKVAERVAESVLGVAAPDKRNARTANTSSVGSLESLAS